MAAIGGSVESLTLIGREFAPTADSDFNFKLGGFENAVEMNGNGTGRIIKTRVPSGFAGVVIENNIDRGDHEFVQEIADGKDFVACAVTLVGGDVYQGSVIVTGELVGSTQSATLAFDLQGAGKFVKQ